MISRGGIRATAVASAIIAALACGGGFAPGNELARRVVKDNEPFAVQYTPSHDGAHHLWLDYDLEWTEHTWDVLGPVTVRVDGEVVERFHMTFHSVGSPTTKGGMRYTLTSSEESSIGSTRGRGTLWLAELPAVPVGKHVEVSGKWNAQPGTTIHSLRLSVND